MLSLHGFFGEIWFPFAFFLCFFVLSDLGFGSVVMIVCGDLVHHFTFLFLHAASNLQRS